MSNATDFCIENGILKKYKGPGRDVVIPDGVTEIGEKAFFGCTSLTSVTIPDSVTKIKRDAFRGCISLTSVILPDSVATIRGGAFSNCTSLTSVTIPSGMTIIEGVVFYNCSSLTSVTIPDSVKEIEQGAFAECKEIQSMTLGPSIKINPKLFDSSCPAFTTQLDELLPHMSDDFIIEVFLEEKWKTLTDEQKATVFMAKQGKKVQAAYGNVIEDAETFGLALNNRLCEKSSAKECNAAANFMLRFHATCSDGLLKKLYDKLGTIKSAKKARLSLGENVILMEKISGESKQNVPPAEQLILRHLADQKMTPLDLQLRFEAFYGKNIFLPALVYQDGKKAADFVLPWLLTVHEAEGRFDGITTDRSVKPCAEAADVIQTLKQNIWQLVLSQLACMNVDATYAKRMYLAYPICRYGDEALMEELTKKLLRRKSREDGYDTSFFRVFRDAVLHSETRAAMLFAEKMHDLDSYAELRGTTADDIRDMNFSDVGLNEQGETEYDLGSQKVTVQLQRDLSFLVLAANGKTSKSIPKRGADPELYAAANADFSAMKKAAREVVQNRRRQLFVEFLSGKERKAEAWKRVYLGNPLLNSVARLVVWQQGADTFTLSDSGAIRADGSVYSIGAAPIAVAHPMNMSDLRLWQQYFVRQGLKQPFEQVWEPVIDPKTIAPNRYKGMMIPYYRFLGMEKHGITVHDYDYHASISIYFEDCDVSIDRTDYSGHSIDMDSPFEIEDFKFRQYNRQVNHIVAYLDKVTVYGRILQDDPSFAALLPNFTLAQITKFLQFSTEHQCTNVSAQLLNYKNEHFADFDPMEEFTLDD